MPKTAEPVEQHRGDPMGPRAQEDTALLAKVTKTLQGKEAPTPPEPEPTPDSKPPVPEAEPSSPPEPKDSGDDKPAIPENYIKAAEHQGIDMESVLPLYETNPKAAIEVLKKVYEATNKLSRDFAALGRKSVELKNQAAAPPPAQTPASQPAIDMAQIKSQYGDDPIVGVIEQLANKVAGLEKPATPPPAAQQPQAEPQGVSQDAAMLSYLNHFFGADTMKPFGQFYGEAKNGDWRTLTNGEYANRDAVINMADQMLIGAQVQGKNMSMDDALTLAHLAVTEQMREQVLRQELKSKVKAKSKGITLTPSATNTLGTPDKNADGTKTEAQLVEDTKVRLAKLMKGEKLV